MAKEDNVKKPILPFLVLSILLSWIMIYGKQIQLERRELTIDYRNEAFFSSISDFEVYKHCLFVVDNQSHMVLEFKISDNTLEFIRTIGRPGQGPGDLELPSKISIWNDTIAVREQSGMSFFNMDGSFINKFRLFSPTLSFVFANERIYSVSPNPNETNLIEVRSREGRMLFSFGNKKEILPSYDINKQTNPLLTEQIVFDGKLIADSDSVYYINRRFGKLIKYSLSGKEILRTEIATFFGKNEETIRKENEKLFLENDFWGHSRKSPEYLIFRDARIENGNIYFLADLFNISNKKLDSFLRIISIDKNECRHVMTYRAELLQGPNLFLFYLAVLSDSNEPTFLIDILSEGEFRFYELKSKKNMDG